MSKNKIKRRSPILHDPLLRKGGVHQKSGKALRRREKIKLKQEWPAKREFLKLLVNWLTLATDDVGRKLPGRMTALGPKQSS